MYYITIYYKAISCVDGFMLIRQYLLTAEAGAINAPFGDGCRMLSILRQELPLLVTGAAAAPFLGRVRAGEHHIGADCSESSPPPSSLVHLVFNTKLWMTMTTTTAIGDGFIFSVAVEMANEAINIFSRRITVERALEHSQTYSRTHITKHRHKHLLIFLFLFFLF